jgi:hypothetical protein
MDKITDTNLCELSQRMPAPPREMLVADEIEVIRTWISAGTPYEPSSIGGEPSESMDARPDRSDASVDRGEAAKDAAQDAAACDAVFGAVHAPDADDDFACSGTRPCAADLICHGLRCDERWECLPHQKAHPCPVEMVSYCGCDGVTFQALSSCADRPFAHIGACDDGVNCDPTDLLCSAEEPNCEQGTLASVVKGAYGPCVPFASCRCEYLWECPHREKYACDRTTWRCGESPTD